MPQLKSSTDWGKLEPFVACCISTFFCLVDTLLWFWRGSTKQSICCRYGHPLSNLTIHCGHSSQNVLPSRFIVLQFKFRHLVSNPLTMAPMARAEPAAANPATPPPMIRTCTRGNKKNVNQHVGAVQNSLGQYFKHNILSPHTFAGGTLPAAVICPVKKRPKLFAASTTALYLKQKAKRQE